MDSNKRTAATVIVVSQTHDILLLKRHKGDRAGYSNLYTLPGGKMDDNDPDVQECASRELFEETGISIPGDGLTYITDEESTKFNIFFFMVFVKDTTVHLSYEHAGYQWYPLSMIKSGKLDDIITPITLQVLKTLSIETTTE